MQLWKAGEFLDAIGYFSRWMPEGLVNEEESKSFGKDLAKFWEMVEVECEENTEVMFTLYEVFKKARNWDDVRLRKELRISGKAIEDIKNRHKPRSEAAGLKMLYKLFPQMVV
jgi:hypothetical protein